jgi:hypothetical protein
MCAMHNMCALYNRCVVYNRCVIYLQNRFAMYSYVLNEILNLHESMSFLRREYVLS